MISTVIKGIIIPILKSYVIKLATKEFAHWVLMEIAESIVKSTKTKEDDKWFAKIKRTIENS